MIIQTYDPTAELLYIALGGLVLLLIGLILLLTASRMTAQQVWCPGCGHKHEPPLCEVGPWASTPYATPPTRP